MKKEDIRIVFMGTPEFAVESLRLLIEGKYNVVAVITQPDKPIGRHGSILQASPVKQYALSQGIDVLQPEKMKDEVFIEKLKTYKADLQVVVAFRMLPEIVWKMPRFGTFNVHASLLPQYRGAAPINWAVINGEKTTGVTTFFLDHNIDTGGIIDYKTFDIPEEADVEYVYSGLMKLGAILCVETVNKIINAKGKITTIKQDDVTALKHAPKIFKETCKIDWTKSAVEIYNFIRGLSPVPGAWTTLYIGKSEATVKIFKTLKTTIPSTDNVGILSVENKHLYIGTADYKLEILSLQLAGKKRMDAKDFINGLNTANRR